VLLANPLVWFVQLDGLIVDARQLPPELQAECVRRGVIPFLPPVLPPAPAPAVPVAPAPVRSRSRRTPPPDDDRSPGLW
jgi:hypothetical protein